MKQVDNFEIFDENLDIDNAQSIIKELNHPVFSKYWAKGYTLEAFCVFNPPRLRLVSGIPDLFIESSDGISISFKKDVAFFALLVFIIDYTNDCDEIKEVRFNSVVYKNLKFNEFISLIQEENRIEYFFKDPRDIKALSSTLFYLVSPYRHNDYYLNLELERWERSEKIY